MKLNMLHNYILVIHVLLLLTFTSNIINLANLCAFGIFNRPWDFSIQDTNEEVRLIVHMWIGLFYSRSTPRFFHVESNLSNLYLEESDSLEMSSSVVSSPAGSELLATALPRLTDTSDLLISTALDLSKKDEDHDSVALDLSLRNSSACLESLTSPLQVSKRGTFDSSEHKEPSETLNSVNSQSQLHEASTVQVLF